MNLDGLASCLRAPPVLYTLLNAIKIKSHGRKRSIYHPFLKALSGALFPSFFSLTAEVEVGMSLWPASLFILQDIHQKTLS